MAFVGVRMKVRTAVIIVFAALLCSCDRQALPEWWPAALGGREAPGKLADGPLGESAHPRLEPLTTVGRDGMRVSISPSFGDYRFLVDFVPQPLDCYLAAGSEFNQQRWEREGCHWIAVRYSVIGPGEGPEANLRRYDFIVPEEEFRGAVAQFNRLARRWRGGEGAVLDGTSVGIEQYRRGRLRSMATNAPLAIEPSNPAANLLLEVHRLLLAYGPSGAVPLNGSFAVGGPASSCMARTFNAPDPDGFGAGDDPCARELARPASRGQ
ncbi:MAG: hypothetical protein M3N07_09070 [Pseudomonadota bacterium]|nr:hypothetical protein [Pseudomonadota bacterium]